MHPLIAAAVTNHVIQDRREAAQRARFVRTRRDRGRGKRAHAPAASPAHRRRLAWKA